jgi:hypothetical protein
MAMLFTAHAMPDATANGQRARDQRKNYGEYKIKYELMETIGIEPKMDER